MEREIHSLAQLEHFASLVRQPSLTGRDALFLANQLVNHGYAEAATWLGNLRAQMPGQAAQHFLARLLRRDAFIQALPLLRVLRDDPVAVQQLYACRGYVFRPGTHRQELAVVIFTTKFNNFSVSNLVLDALFADMGVSRLFLKDISTFLYLRGVEGLADTLTDLPAKLEQLLAGHGVRQAIITGFSSGGYASLYVATQMELLGYVGYSIYTDVSTASALPQRQMFRALQGQVPEELLLDMRQTVDTPSQRLTLYYGQRDPIDRAHAQHLEGCRGVKIVAHPDANHEVPAHLMEEGRFAAPFLALLGAAAP